MKADRKRSLACRAPIADAILKLSSQIFCSFHALPICGGHSITGSLIADKYEELFGAQLFHSELTITGSHFDSFFFAKKEIKEAEEMAAVQYGATDTLFITVGTTVSNQIALDALYNKGARVLIDKGCHQSLHFDLNRRNANIDYLHADWCCAYSAKSIWSLNTLLKQVLQAQSEEKPYDLIILNAHSYDGIVYDIPGIIRHLLENGVCTKRFLIDEAWGASNYFHPALKQLTAMAAGCLLKDYPDLKIVSTQSAHKSLSCLRQASMIHYCGSKDFGERLRLSRFKLHTTSPSYPIMASLDLARMQMQLEGEALAMRSNALAERFREELQACSLLSLAIQDEVCLPQTPIPYAQVDPGKVSINMKAIGLNVVEVKERLFKEYGIYINRNTETSLLLNFHIGIQDKCVFRLLQALRELASDSNTLQTIFSTENTGRFVIPYPPGVPLIVPGEVITPAIEEQIRSIKRSGAHIFYT